MTLEDWDALCEREWEERHGDIFTLFLTAKSRRELETDLLLNPRESFILNITAQDLEEMKNGHHLFVYITNPITRTACKISDAIRDKDQAEVRYLAELSKES